MKNWMPISVLAGLDPAIQLLTNLDGRPRGTAVRFNSAAISTSSSRKGALRALSGIWPQTKPEYWAGTPDKRQGAFRGECVREDALSAGWKSLPQAVTACEVESNCAAVRRGGEQLETKGQPVEPVLGLNPGIEPIAVRFYITDTRPNLDVAPESALALIRGPGPILRFRLGQIPDRTRRAVSYTHLTLPTKRIV